MIAFLSRESDDARIKRCDREGIMLVTEAALSRWFQEGEFETLAACRAEQQKPLTEKEKAAAAFASGFTSGSGVSKDDLIRSSRARAYALEVHRQRRSTFGEIIRDSPKTSITA